MHSWKMEIINKGALGLGFAKGFESAADNALPILFSCNAEFIGLGQIRGFPHSKVLSVIF